MGRKLQITEMELRDIELDYVGVREKAFQMLCVWKEKNPDLCTMENLISVLNTVKLRNTALLMLR